MFLTQIILPKPDVKKSIHCKVGLEPTIRGWAKVQKEWNWQNDHGKANEILGKIKLKPHPKFRPKIVNEIVCMKLQSQSHSLQPTFTEMCSVKPDENKDPKAAFITNSAEI